MFLAIYNRANEQPVTRSRRHETAYQPGVGHGWSASHTDSNLDLEDADSLFAPWQPETNISSRFVASLSQVKSSQVLSRNSSHLRSFTSTAFFKSFLSGFRTMDESPVYRPQISPFPSSTYKLTKAIRQSNFLSFAHTVIDVT